MYAPPAPLLDLRSRKEALRRFLDSDPELRPHFTKASPELTARAAHIEKWERLAVGLKERV